MSVAARPAAATLGTPFHERASALNRTQQWRPWSGYLAALQYAESHDVEYWAIRTAAALVDVSPLFKYVVSGSDAARLVDRVTVRAGSRLAPGRVQYTCWCDEDGRVIDDGTVARLDETTYRWTAAEPTLRWLRLNAVGLDVEVQDVSDGLGALALQGPLARDVLEGAAGEAFADLRYFGRRGARVAGVAVDVTRTGYTGDLGYEVWVPHGDGSAVWDALVEAGEPYALRPAGLLALDVARVEAGLLLLDVDYTSSLHALTPRQAYSPFELGVLGRLVDLDKPDFVGRRALAAERARGGPSRRLVGLEVDWEALERLFEAHGLPPHLPATTSRTPVPVLAGRRQVGRATSTAWSPLLKRVVALASVEAAAARPGTRLEVEWTVEAVRSFAPARVVDLPFFDPPRKRS